jgi:hydroxyacylglutathione hydrolase
MKHEINILTLPLPLRMGSVNCYLIRTEAGHVLIDTGGSNKRKDLLAELQRAGCTPASLRIVLLTHGDFDHIGNAAYIRSTYQTALAMHPDDLGMAERGDMFVNRSRPNVLVRTALPLFSRLDDSDRFTPDLLLHNSLDLSGHGLQAEVIHLPGHSLGSVGILTTNGHLFCGDLFENTKGPVLNSLMDDPVAADASVAKLRGLDIRTVYPGHGRPFSMDYLTKR